MVGGRAMKRISHALTYPGTTIEQVAAMIGDPPFRAAVADHQGVVRRSVSVSDEMPARRIEVELVPGIDRGSEVRRVGKEGVSTCRTRWPPYHYKKINNLHIAV